MTPLPFIPEDDPALPLPPAAEMERALLEQPEEFAAYLTARQEKIRLRKFDPFRHGYEPEIWHVVDDLLVRGIKVVLIDPQGDVPRTIIGGSEVYLPGGNRASKTQYAASRVVRMLVSIERARAWCFHTTGPTSISMQQPRIYEYLPIEWRQLKRHPYADIKFSDKNGFAGVMPCFVGPNRSRCEFKNYAQGLGTIEGDELNIAWFDELAPIDMIIATRYRLATRKGVLIITFTAVEGYSPTFRSLTDNATDVLRVQAKELPLRGKSGELVGYETVPRVQQAANEDLKIVYFHIFDNPFGGVEEIVRKARNEGREGIMLRCYGVPEKAIGAQFPTFRRAIHVLKRDQWKEHGQEGTNKQIVDPCSGRNWFMIWARALPDDYTIVVYREWPSPGQYIPGVGDPGDWAVADGEKKDGKAGTAQKPWGFGFERYTEEILRCEGWRDDDILAAIEANDARTPPKKKPGEHGEAELIFQRLMDSRFGAAPTLQRGEAKTLIESMSETGLDFDPAPGEHQREGIDQINDLLHYKQTEPISALNKPRLLIHEDCKNLIWALENWTGLDGPKGACKDAIDVLRYLALNPPVHYPPEAFMCRGGGAY